MFIITKQSQRKSFGRDSVTRWMHCQCVESMLVYTVLLNATVALVVARAGLLLTYGAGYSPRLLRARYSPATRSLLAVDFGSPKPRRYLLNKSSNTIIWRLNIRQVNKDL